MRTASLPVRVRLCQREMLLEIAEANFSPPEPVANWEHWGEKRRQRW